MSRYLFALLLVMLLVLPAAAQTAEDLYQQAVRIERLTGNTQAAIALYEQIVEEHSENREVTAKALLNLGKAYEAQGSDKARNAYTRVATDFAEYESLVSEARLRLTAIDVPVNYKDPFGANHDVGESIEHLLEKHDGFTYYGVTLSPDGNLLVGYRYGDLPMIDLRTGEMTMLGVKEGVGNRMAVWGEFETGEEYQAPNEPSWAHHAAFSPDQRKIAFMLGDSVISKPNEWVNTYHHLLRVHDFKSGTTETVLKLHDFLGGWVRDASVAGWSEDGNTIYGIAGTWGGVDIGTEGPDQRLSSLFDINLRTGEARLIHEQIPAWAANLCLADQKRYAAFAYWYPTMDPGDDPWNFSIDLETGEKVIWENKWGEVDWLACNASTIIGRTDFFGEEGIYTWSWKDGRPENPTLLMQEDQRKFFPVALSESGKYLFAVGQVNEYYQAKLDPENGQLASRIEVLERSVGWYRPVHDIAPNNSQALMGHQWGCLGILDLDSGNDDCVDFEGYNSERGKPVRMRWSLDGETIIGNMTPGELGSSFGIFQKDGTLIKAIPGFIFLDVVDESSVLVEYRREADTCISIVNLSDGSGNDVFCTKAIRQDSMPAFLAEVDQAQRRALIIYGDAVENIRLNLLLDLDTGITAALNWLPGTKEPLMNPHWLTGQNAFVFRGKENNGIHLFKADLNDATITPWFEDASRFDRFATWGISSSGDRIVFFGAPPAPPYHRRVIQVH